MALLNFLFYPDHVRAATRKHTMVGQTYFKGEGEQTYVWGENYATVNNKYNK